MISIPVFPPGSMSAPCTSCVAAAEQCMSHQQIWSDKFVRLPASPPSRNSTVTSIRSSACTVDNEGPTRISTPELPKHAQPRTSWPLHGPIMEPHATSPKDSSWPLHDPIMEFEPHTTSPKGSSFESTMVESYDNYFHSRFSWHESTTDFARGWIVRWFTEWWLLEIIAWVLSTTCVIIISTVLWRYHGQPISNWRLSISLNTFVAIFSTLTRAALLLPTTEALGQLKWNWFLKSQALVDFEVMDSASRGPWGSALLLKRRSGPTIASLGAVVLLLTLPLDIIFQQLITYPSVLTLDETGSAKALRVVLFSTEAVTTADTNITRTDTSSSIYKCSTSICSFEPFYTLAFDVSCGHIPNFLTSGCQKSSSTWIAAASEDSNTIADEVLTCGWYLKSKSNNHNHLMSGYALDSKNGSVTDILGSRAFPSWDVPLNWTSNDTRIPPLLDFIQVSAPGGFEGALKNSTPSISRCEIRPVVKLINSTISAGELNETVLDVLHFETKGIQQHFFQMTLPDLSSSSGVTTFGVENTTKHLGKEAWEYILRLTLVLSMSSASERRVLSGVDNSSVMNDLVRTLDQRLRNDAGESIIGKAWTHRVLIKVEWGWICVPAILLVFGLVFLVSTIVRSEREKRTIGVFKTSILAVLFNGLANDIQEYIKPGSNRSGHMRAMAANINV